MDLFYKTQLKTTQQKISSYMTLLSYRYMNLCVKAEAASLIPVNVIVFGSVKNLEEVAEVAIPDDYHLAVIPKSDEKESLKMIVEGVSLSHPEFKLAIKTTKAQNKDKQYLEYEMPEVDKNRRDFLTEAVKSLFDEAKVKIDELYTNAKIEYSDLLSGKPEELDEVNKELDNIHDTCIEGLLESKLSKLQEIEDGYRRYMSLHAGEDSMETNSGYDVTKSMKME